MKRQIGLLSCISILIPVLCLAAEPTIPARWKVVAENIDSGRFAKALDEVQVILDRAQPQGDAENWTRALIERRILRDALGAPAAAAGEFRSAAWPAADPQRAILELHDARSLLCYVSRFSAEIRGRESIAGADSLDLEHWDLQRFTDEIDRALLATWSRRRGWNDLAPDGWRDYVVPNTYPADIRGSLRDLVAYTWASHLENSALWTVRQSDEAREFTVDDLLAVMAAPDAESERRIADPDVHPLLKLGYLMADLRAWHQSHGRAGAALEAELAYLRRIHARVSGDARRRVRERLEAVLDGVNPREPWWSLGQWERARCLQQDSTPDNLIRARLAAAAGAARHPHSVGGKRCAAMVAEITAPQYKLSSTAVDAPGQRTIAIDHANLSRLYLRAWRVPVVARWDDHRPPRFQEIQDLMKARRADLSWSVDLPATEDYHLHRTWTGLPPYGPGAYVVVASPSSGFAVGRDWLQAVDVLISDLVVTWQPLAGGVELVVRDAHRGEPVEGATVVIIERPSEDRAAVRDTLRTDQGGRAWHACAADAWLRALVTNGSQVAVVETGGAQGRYRAPTSRAFVYTDRAVYRPGQTVHWKVVAYGADSTGLRLQTTPRHPLNVSLLDAKRETVASDIVTTNDFGSASGSFVLPDQRLLGRWTIATDQEAGAAIRVEEYRRPTFAARILDPDPSLQFGRPIALVGEATYLFGGPLDGGRVVWRVRCGSTITARGDTTLGADGRFAISAPAPTLPKGPAESRSGKMVQVEADVTDTGGETHTVVRYFTVGVAAVGANFENPFGFFTPGKPDSVRVSRTDPDGKPLPGKGRWTLFALGQPPLAVVPSQVPIPLATHLDSLLATPGDTLQPRWQSSTDWWRLTRDRREGPVVATGDVIHDAIGKAMIPIDLPAVGVYRLEYTTQDDDGQERRIWFDLLAADDGPLDIKAPLIVIRARGQARVGETTRVLVHSVLPDALVRVQVLMGGEVIRSEYLTGGALLELPVTEAAHRGFSVQASLIRDHEFLQATEHVPVPWDEKHLDVTLGSLREELQPGESSSFTVKVTGRGGEPAQGELLALMYDRSLDDIARHRLAEPRYAFPSGDYTTEPRANLGKAMETWVSTARRDRPTVPDLRPDRLRTFPGSGAKMELDPFGRLVYTGPDPDVVKALEAAGIPVLPAYVVEGAAYMVETTSVTAGSLISAQRFEHYALDEPAPKSIPSQDTSDPLAAAPPRRDFAETALFLPHVAVDDDGAANVAFQMPETATEWRLMVQALTTDLSSGSAERRVRTRNDLLVRPYLPRFLREGDAQDVPVMITNGSERELSGQLELSVTDPATGRDLREACGLDQPRRAFRVGAGASITITYPLRTPTGLDAMLVRAAAVSGDLTDGEQHELPVLPARMALVESRFAALRGNASRALDFPSMRRDDTSRRDQRLVVTVDTQLLTGMLAAVPYLVEYPYECTEQTLNRFLCSSMLASAIETTPSLRALADELSSRDTPQEAWAAPDPNRRLRLEESPWLEPARGGDQRQTYLDLLAPTVVKEQRRLGLDRLHQIQNDDGGFPWFPGGASSAHMTAYVLLGLARGAEFGLDTPDDIAQGAWRFLRAQCPEVDDSATDIVVATAVNYILSALPRGARETAGFTDAERSRLLDLAWQRRLQLPRLLQAYLAFTLHRAGRHDDARDLYEAILDGAKSDPDLGVYWQPEERSWLWTNDTIEGHALILRLACEIAPDDPRRDGLAQWLFLHKQFDHWKSTRATAEAIYALVGYLRASETLAVREEVTVQAGRQVRLFASDPADPTAGHDQLILVDDAIDATAAPTVSVAKSTPGLAFATATWHYSTTELPMYADSDLFAITRHYYCRRLEGDRRVLTPLAPGDAIHVGDEIEVHLAVTASHAAEYVHLRDPRPAGCEPLDKISGARYESGLAWYGEVRDAADNFFLEQLPAGEYTLKHRLRVTMAGTFAVQPATLQSMYAPEFAAHSAGEILNVEP